MRLFLWIGITCLCGLTAAQAQVVPFETKIDSVTLYLTGAQLTRVGSVELPAGTHTLELTGLSPDLELKSLRVLSNASVQAVATRRAYAWKQEGSTAQDSLLREYWDAQDRQTRVTQQLKAQQAVLQGFMEVKDGQAKAAELEEQYHFLASSFSALQAQRMTVREEFRKVEAQLQREGLLQGPLGEKSNRGASTTLTIHLAAAQAGPVTVQVQYFVQFAHWKPRYNLGVLNLQSPMRLEYLAEVEQQTSEDWENVMLTITNYYPKQYGQLPTLLPWHLGDNDTRLDRHERKLSPQRYYSEGGEDELWQQAQNEHSSFMQGKQVEFRVFDQQTQTPIKDVRITVMDGSVDYRKVGYGQYVVTLPDLTRSTLVVGAMGYQSRSVPALRASDGIVFLEPNPDMLMLPEIEVWGQGIAREKRALGYAVSTVGSDRIGQRDLPELMGQPKSTLKTTEQRFEITFESRVTIRHQGSPRTIPLRHHWVPTTFEHRVLPLASPQAFLMAKLTDFQELQLLPGPVTLFDRGQYLGVEEINPKQAVDTLTLSLGADPEVTVRRTSVRRKDRPTWYFLFRKHFQSWEIEVNNQRHDSIRVRVYEVPPHYTFYEEELVYIKLTQGKERYVRSGTHRGTLHWHRSLAPGGSTQMRWGYWVRYAAWLEPDFEQ